MTQYLINLAISVSQFANVLCAGDCDEMLCARAWRLQGQSQFWKDVVNFFDNYCWPLSSWTGDSESHCQACYLAELDRLQKRVADYDQA